MLKPSRFATLKLSRAVTASFALRTHQETLVRIVKREVNSYYNHCKNVTRNILKIRNEQPNKLLLDQQQALQKAQQDFQSYLFNLPFNDSNPTNFLKLNLQPYQPQEITQQVVDYLIPHQPRPAKVLVTGIRRECYTSMRRIFPIARQLIGKHVYEAIELIGANNKKASTFLLAALKMVKSHATQKGLDEERLYVQSIITNKLNRFKSLRYHAKSKMGRAKRETSQIRVTLEERPAKQMFKDSLLGKTPNILSMSLRNNILQKNADLKEIQRYQFVLTAKGRQQQKLMVKRRAQLLYQEKKAGGKLVSIKHLTNLIVEEEAENLAKDYEQSKMKQTKFQLQARQTAFKKNEETYR